MDDTRFVVGYWIDGGNVGMIFSGARVFEEYELAKKYSDWLNDDQDNYEYEVEELEDVKDCMI